MAKKLLAKRNGTKVQFECRLSYVHLDAPWGKEGNAPKYSVTCMVPDSDTQTLDEINKAIEEAKAVGKVKKWKGIVPKSLKVNVHRGNEHSDNPDFADMTYFQASSKDEVPVFNRLRERIDPRQCYSGCYALVEANFFPYDAQGAGVSAALNQVLKLRDGDALGGRGAADAFSAFGDELDEEDDF